MVTKEDINEIYDYYIINKQINKQKTENEVIRRMSDFIDLIISKSTIYPIFLPEFRSELIINIFRAFDCYDKSKNVQLFGWVYRIASQTAYNFIKDKCNPKRQIEYNSVYFSPNESEDPYRYRLDFEDSELTPDKKYEADEAKNNASAALEYLLSKILKGVLEVEVYKRYNGICGYEIYSNKPADIATDMNLSEKTVRNIIDRNNEKMNKFRKWLKAEEYDSYEPWIIDEYVKFKNNK